jgi:uncharacterized membrane-anchored protein YhcB (DUF1043 family)
MSKILWLIVGVPLGIVLVALGVANREPVTIALDPFRPTAPAIALHPPLFVAFFVVLAAGVILGGIAVWLSHHKVRSALSKSQSELARVKRERDQLVAERTVAAARDSEVKGPSLPALGGPRRVA